MQLGKFRVLERVAAGGMGVVYRAELCPLGHGDDTGGDDLLAGDHGIRRIVGLKEVREEFAENPDFLKLFMEEARVAMALSHSNIVQTFDVVQTNGKLLLVMEWIDGVDLRGLLAWKRGKPLEVAAALFVAVEVLKGLGYAHRRRDRWGRDLRIVHRDVSPGNILLSTEGEVKVADFGIAKSTMRQIQSVEDGIKGKIPYVAPEQLHNQGVDERADIYSVGVVLYELLSGRRMIDASTMLAAMQQVTQGTYPPFKLLRPQLSDALQRIVESATALEPQRRFATAAEMQQAIMEFVRQQDWLLSPEPLRALVAQATSASPKRLQNFGELLANQLPAEATALKTTLASPGLHPSSPLEASLANRLRSGSRRRWAVGGVLALACVVGGATVGFDRFSQTPTPRAMSKPARPSSRVPGPASAAAAEWSPGPTLSPPPADLPALPPRPVERSENVAAKKKKTARSLAARATPTSAADEAERPVASSVVGSATLSANTAPWSYLSVDGVQVGPTPILRHELSAGLHRLEFHNPLLKMRRSLSVNLAAGQHRRIVVDFEETP